MSQQKTKDEIKFICKNKRAAFDLDIKERYEAGIVLLGSEVKSCREGKAQLNDAYVQVKNGEAFLVNSHIAEYKYANLFNHDPLRVRKLLLKQREIAKLADQIKIKGATAVPLALYFRNDRVKVDIGIGKGMSKIDKRGRTQEREAKRDMERAVRRSKY
jgi:SsrA-binding protein